MNIKIKWLIKQNTYEYFAGFRKLLKYFLLFVSLTPTLVLSAEIYDSTSPPKSLDGFSPEKHYQLRTLASGLSYPWSIAELPNGDYLIALRSGSIHRLNSSGELSEAFGNTPNTYVKLQGGYFDIVLDQDFENNQIVYISFAYGTPKKNATRVIKAKLNAALTGFEFSTPIFTVTPFKDTPAHYGGRLTQLADSSLLMTTGDGFQYREASQDPYSQLGKTVRFLSDGSIPSNNPYADGLHADPYVYSLGHRNPQGIVISENNRIFLNEHGAKGGDEINLILAGENYGWPKTTHGVNYSGATISPYNELPNVRAPLLHWTPSIAPSGLAFYEHDAFPQLSNCLLSGGLVSKDIRCAKLEEGKIVAEYSLLDELDQRIRDVRVSSSGTLLLLTDSEDGAVIEVIPITRPKENKPEEKVDRANTKQTLSESIQIENLTNESPN